MNDRTVRTVTGYLPGIDFPCKTAIKYGLPFRFAVAMDTWRQDNPDMFYDTELLLALCAGFIHKVEHDTLLIDHQRTSKDKHQLFETLESYAAFLQSLPQDEQDPLMSLKLLKNGEVVLYAEPALYSLVGGPAPYHDTYTFALYSADDMGDVFVNVARETCHSLGAQIEREFRGLGTPKISWWQRLSRVIFR